MAWLVKTTNTYFFFLLLITFGLVTISDSVAQRNVNYQDLVKRNQQPNSSFSHLTLPANDDDVVQFVVVFHLPYSSLPFKKNPDRSSDYKYLSSLELGLEVFKSDEANFDKKNKDNISVAGLDPAGRSFWSDTAFAKTYDSTKSDSTFLSGFIKVRLKPGSYNYVMHMKRGDQSESQISRTQKINLAHYNEKKTGDILVSPQYNKNEETTSRFILNPRGNTVEYTKDFYALANIPGYNEESSYSIEIRKLTTFNRDTTKTDTTFSKSLSPNLIKTNVRPQLMYDNNKPYVNLSSADNGYTYATVKVPNSNFPNALYQISIKNDDTDSVVARDNFRSQWLDIPVSLLNLDVAIEMLRFIVDKETIRRISDGTAAQREKKFREFWEKRDPTPDTEFNELMSEYYDRIDYAYENFSTENTVGFNSDRGEVYIKYGPPNDINRKFPNSGATTEVWTYPNRKFVFRATTGFGDFKLISNQSR